MSASDPWHPAGSKKKPVTRELSMALARFKIEEFEAKRAERSMEFAERALEHGWARKRDRGGLPSRFREAQQVAEVVGDVREGEGDGDA